MQRVSQVNVRESDEREKEKEREKLQICSEGDEGMLIYAKWRRGRFVHQLQQCPFFDIFSTYVFSAFASLFCKTYTQVA